MFRKCFWDVIVAIITGAYSNHGEGPLVQSDFKWQTWGLRQMLSS